MKVSYLLWATVMVADFVHSSATLRGTQGGEEKELADSFASPTLPGESGAEPKSEQEDNGEDVDDANLNDAATVVDLGRLGQSFTDIYDLSSTVNIDTNVKQDNVDDDSDPTANTVDAVVGREVETDATSNGPDESPESTQHVGEYLRQSFGAVTDDVPKAAPKQKERKVNNHYENSTLLLNTSMMEEQSISGIEPFPLACDKDEPIPKVIIQTVKSMDDLNGLDWFKYHFSLKEQNSDYTFLIFDDIKALEFIDTFFQDSALPDVIRKVPRSVMKADLFRLAAVSALGGFYMDMDMLAKESFDPIVHSGCGAVFPKEWWKDDDAFLERHFALPVDFEDHWQVGNYAFAALPNHPLVVDSLEEAIKRSIELIATKESADDITDLDVLRTTGPYMLSEVYHAGRKAGKYKDVMHIQGDDSKPLKEDQEYGFNWHKFGPYAEHMLYHTWVQPEEASE